jgi:hypothetical protein
VKLNSLLKGEPWKLGEADGENFNIYYNIVRVIKSRRMWKEGHVARMNR